MATKEEWVNLFESTKGRKPTAAEYAQAMRNDFDISEFAPRQAQQTPVQEPTASQANAREDWMKLFESVSGRKPTADEFMQAKATGFDKAQMASILNPAPVSSSVAETTQTSAESESLTSEASPEITHSAGQADQPVREAAPFVQPAESVVQQGAPVQPVQGPADPAQVPVGPASSAFNPAGQMPDSGLSGSAQQVSSPTSTQTGFQPTASAMPQGQMTGMAPAKSSNFLSLILPIISLALSVLFMILSFLVAAPLFLGLSVLGLIGAAVLIILNLKGKPVLSIVATGVALLALIVTSVATFASVLHNTTDSSSASTSKKDVNAKDYIDKDYKFEWKQDDFEDLEAKSDTVSDVIKKHGKASDAQISGDRLTLTYKDSKAGSSNSVMVVFEKQYNGKFVLSSGNANFNADDIDSSRDYKSDWKKEDYDALKEGDNETGAGGSSWNDIKSKHPKVSSAYYNLSFYGDEDISYGLSVTYSDYGTDDSHLTYVGLTFKSDDGGKTYNLSSKYSDKDN